MKNELGIEVCCGFCAKSFCSVSEMKDCEKNPNKHFKPTDLIKTARIKELQEQQFTEKELNHLQVALILAKDEFNFTPADNLLKKIEQTLKNLKGNLNKQQ